MFDLVGQWSRADTITDSDVSAAIGLMENEDEWAKSVQFTVL